MEDFTPDWSLSNTTSAVRSSFFLGVTSPWDLCWAFWTSSISRGLRKEPYLEAALNEYFVEGIFWVAVLSLNTGLAFLGFWSF